MQGTQNYQARVFICVDIADFCEKYLRKGAKVYLEGQPYILRIYLRDKDATYREQNLGQLLKGIVPIPHW